MSPSPDVPGPVEGSPSAAVGPLVEARRGPEEAALATLDPELAAELPTFEQFFKTFGFKRVHGRIWGLLVLSERPLSSRDICDQLELSQAAVSTTLSELSEWRAITSQFDSQRRCHLHAPVGNALTIAATILRRREQVAFEQFRLTADRSLAFVRQRYGDRDPRVLTLRSIVSACEIAEALMSLLVGAVANALGDPQSILSRAIHAAVKVGFSGMPRSRVLDSSVEDAARAPRVEGPDSGTERELEDAEEGSRG
jgi:DNA-binding transcriptional ArsR family regulator